MAGSILVASDFSARSDRALRRATMLARQAGADIVLAHVVDEDQPARLIDTQADAALAMLEDFVRTLREFDGVNAGSKLAIGDVNSGILKVADDVEADLIVLGAHRRQVRDVFVGTTVERTIVHSRRPVLMAAGVPTAPYLTALVALDQDERSRALAQRLGGLAILEGLRTIAMHAFDAPARGMMHRAMADQSDVDDYLSTEQLRAGGEFARFLADTPLAAAEPMLTPINGSAARTILDCAEKADASLIVVGTSQRRGIERFILGSVAEDVLAHADRDVLVIPD